MIEPRIRRNTAIAYCALRGLIGWGGRCPLNIKLDGYLNEFGYSFHTISHYPPQRIHMKYQFFNIAVAFGIYLTTTSSPSAQDIDPRTQCETIRKGATASDRSYQPIYGPCCKDAKAMKSKEDMEKCIGQRVLEEMQRGKMR
jgi:hypothetical protein